MIVVDFRIAREKSGFEVGVVVVDQRDVTACVFVELDDFVDTRIGVVVPCCEHQEVRAIRDRALIVGGGPDPGSHVGVGDDEELEGLGAARRRCHPHGFDDCVDLVLRDRLVRVHCFRGVAPVQAFVQC